MEKIGVKYAVVFERAESGRNWGAYVLDLPGCTTTGKTLEDCKRNITEAIEGHIATLKELGRPVPEPTSVVDYAEAT